MIAGKSPKVQRIASMAPDDSSMKSTSYLLSHSQSLSLSLSLRRGASHRQLNVSNSYFQLTFRGSNQNFLRFYFTIDHPAANSAKDRCCNAHSGSSVADAIETWSPSARAPQQLPVQLQGPVEAFYGADWLPCRICEMPLACPAD